MIPIRTPPRHRRTDNPELYREVTSYLLYSQMELLEYAAEDFNFLILDEQDLPMLNDLGPPEETIRISIKADGMLQTRYRIICPTAVIFIPAEISDHFSF